jgi:tungstate transport system ATP-binding protein
MSLFLLENIRFQYGDRPVLDIPNLAINEGGVVCLTGANGSGKSTLINILAGLLQPSGGRVLYRGMDPSMASADLKDNIRRELGICLQSPYLFRTTVEGNVAFGLAARGIKGKERSGRVEEALNDVGLAGFGNRRYHALSGGEIQRVALARALAIKPRVLLLDEPMANVDTATRLLLEKILERLIGTRGITIIFSTHDVDQALRLGQQIITLHDGLVVEGGLENTFHGTLRKEGGGWVFDTGLARLTVLTQKSDARTAIIPPEAILLSLDPKSTSARNILKGKINGIRMRNGSVEITVDAGEEFISRITEGSLKSLGLHLGMEIYLLIKAGAIRLY